MSALITAFSHALELGAAEIKASGNNAELAGKLLSGADVMRDSGSCTWRELTIMPRCLKAIPKLPKRRIRARWRAVDLLCSPTGTQDPSEFQIGLTGFLGANGFAGLKEL